MPVPVCALQVWHFQVSADDEEETLYAGENVEIHLGGEALNFSLGEIKKSGSEERESVTK